jgi:hypothetical protein
MHELRLVVQIARAVDVHEIVCEERAQGRFVAGDEGLSAASFLFKDLCDGVAAHARYPSVILGRLATAEQRS